MANFCDILAQLSFSPFIDLKDLAHLRCTTKTANKICTQYEDFHTQKYISKYDSLQGLLDTQKMKDQFMSEHNITQWKDVIKTSINISWMYKNVSFTDPSMFPQLLSLIINIRNPVALANVISEYACYIKRYIDLYKVLPRQEIMVYVIEMNVALADFFIQCVKDYLHNKQKYPQCKRDSHPIFQRPIINFVQALMRETRIKCYKVISIENTSQGILGKTIRHEDFLQIWYHSMHLDQLLTRGPRGGLFYVDRQTNKKIYVNK